MALPSQVGYEGFEDPENLYPGNTNTTLPTVYTAACQIRQSGVGSISGHGKGSSVLPALANPPAAMVTAANKVLTQQVVTSNDINRYYPSSTVNPNQ